MVSKGTNKYLVFQYMTQPYHKYTAAQAESASSIPEVVQCKCQKQNFYEQLQ